MNPTGLLIFDGDCGFCSTSARFVVHWVSGGRYDVQPWQRLDLGAFGLTEDDAVAAAQFVRPDGTVLAGEQAIGESLRRGHLVWRPVGWAIGLPGVRRLAARVYVWVADHRYALPGGTPACAVPQRSA